MVNVVFVGSEDAVVDEVGVIIGCFGVCWHQLIDEVVDVGLSVLWRMV
jgi:hypothetical protein